MSDSLSESRLTVSMSVWFVFDGVIFFVVSIFLLQN